MNHDLPHALRDILKGININEEVDIAFVVASTFNLYAETMRRCHGRMLITPADAVNIFNIIDVLLTPVEVKPVFDTTKKRTLSMEEEKDLLGAVETQVTPIERRA